MSADLRGFVRWLAPYEGRLFEIMSAPLGAAPDSPPPSRAPLTWPTAPLAERLIQAARGARSPA